MFAWYRDAARCYVYLADVSAGGSSDGTPSPQSWRLAFQRSRWFTRGWTLQELIAPRSVDFFSVEGQRLGDRDSMIQEIHSVTGISIEALQGKPLHQLSIEERMSWAEQRETKREEDAAYSLLGIFDVHMPLLYGEGRQKALTRLQKEMNSMSNAERPALLQMDGLHDQSRIAYSYTGPVFDGAISGRYVIPGAHTTGGTVNFNFPA